MQITVFEVIRILRLRLHALETDELEERLEKSSWPRTSVYRVIETPLSRNFLAFHDNDFICTWRPRSLPRLPAHATYQDVTKGQTFVKQVIT